MISRGEGKCKCTVHTGMWKGKGKYVYVYALHMFKVSFRGKGGPLLPLRLGGYHKTEC